MQPLDQQFSSRSTPQWLPIPGSTQRVNDAGGFCWQVDDWTQLDRFLILGTEGGTYYVREASLTRESAQTVERCIKADGCRVVGRTAEISLAGRAPKNDPALFVLAMCASLGDARTRRAAFEALTAVARTGTHLFHFVRFREAFGGWGRGAREAVARWYTNKTPAQLALQAVKYAQRDGWSHKDILRLSHPFPPSAGHSAVFRFMTGFDGASVPEGRLRMATSVEDTPRLIRAVEELAKLANEPKAAARLIHDQRIPREAVPTGLLKDKGVWAALLREMPLTAMIRNLGTMSKVGLLTPLSKAERLVLDRLSDADLLRRARVHPIQVLSALRTYAQGHGERSSAQWRTCPRIIDTLDAAFYLSFRNVEPSGKALLLALDVSGSMACGCVAGVPGLTPRDASAAMALVTAKVEPNYRVLAFCDELVELNISPNMRLDDAVRAVSALRFGGTNCALPMLWARENRAEVDGFIVYTDSETWCGPIHPAQALSAYRRESGRPAKSVVVAMTASTFSIADPGDAGMLDVVGFDTATPQLIEQFMRD